MTDLTFEEKVASIMNSNLERHEKEIKQLEDRHELDKDFLREIHSKTLRILVNQLNQKLGLPEMTEEEALKLMV